MKDHAEKICNHHRNINEDALFAQFVNIFQDEINNLKNPIEFTPFDTVDTCFFSRKNPPTKPRVWRKRLDDEDKILFCKWGLFNRLRGLALAEFVVIYLLILK